MTEPLGLRIEQRGAVQLITFDRPDRRNALRLLELRALDAHLEALVSDDATRVLVVTGTSPAFCAGEDLEEALSLAMTPGSLDDTAALLQQLTRRVRALPQIAIAAINRPAVGLGAELAIAMDIRYAARTGWFILPEVERGLFETNGVTWLLPRLVGYGRAAEWMLSARRIPADEALAAGLVSRVEDPTNLLPSTLATAERIAGFAPLAVRQLKTVLQAASEGTLEEALAAEVTALARCVASEDAAEGMRAFLERRPPSFRGR